MKPIKDYSKLVATLPYASEIFGVYQPLIGWKSRRKLSWIAQGIRAGLSPLIQDLTRHYRGDVVVDFNSDYQAQLVRLGPGAPRAGRLLSPGDSLLKQEISAILNTSSPTEIQWNELLQADSLTEILKTRVFPRFQERTSAQTHEIFETTRQAEGETEEQFYARQKLLVAEMQQRAREYLVRESTLAGVLIDLAQAGNFEALRQFFYAPSELDASSAPAELQTRLAVDFEDPYLTFDPGKDLGNVTVSPLGIVHLFRQFFFEFDTFLGPSTGHVWLSPGSTVELLEISTRRVITEKAYEVLTEQVTKTDLETTQKDEFSDAVKQENRGDTKVGITSTVSQSWVSGSAVATASLNLDRTQQDAREQAHKRLRDQSEKLSTEIRQNYRTTFKTVTDTTDTSSKRYLLTNSTQELINYELRRKMRQVGVQVQDMGSYLCWETFVDEPGNQLGLAHLVHLAKPADLLPQPNQKEIAYPPRVEKTFQANVPWNFGDNRQFNDPVLGFRELTTIPLPVQPDPGYRVEFPDGYVNISLISLAGPNSENQRYAFRGKLVGGSQIKIGVVTGPEGIEWDEPIDFLVGGMITFVPTDAKKAEVDAANADIIKNREAANRENNRLQNEAFVKAAKERIKLASNIKPRKFEELREEERTIVYRNLIRSLMGDSALRDPRVEEFKSRHVLSELINSVFDVDKMLYFVAPEWWKPRLHPEFNPAIDGETVVPWRDRVDRPDNYYITEESSPARLGSSLGWLLQLDGDNARNAFLNAPWVKAVMPVRPGKELAAIAWLKNAHVEGADGLDADYVSSAQEHAHIRAKLLDRDPDDPIGTRANVTIADALRFLCQEVADKHTESTQVDKFPKGPAIHDDQRVSATPVEKVYEHGFHPLENGFRVDPNDPDPNNPDRHFQVFDQWVEVLPTDQIVPVPVKYDPKSGRQL